MGAAFGQNLQGRRFNKDFLFAVMGRAGLGGVATWGLQLAALASPRTRQPTVIKGLFLSAPRDFLLQVDCNSSYVLGLLARVRHPACTPGRRRGAVI